MALEVALAPQGKSPYLSSALSPIKQDNPPKDLVLYPVSRDVGVSVRVLLRVIVTPEGEWCCLFAAPTVLRIVLIVWVLIAFVESAINLLEKVDCDGVHCYGD